VNPNSGSSSTHVVHILAVVGALMLLIGSAGQAWDSLRGFRAEFQMFANELGESFIQSGGLVMEVGRRLSQIPFDELMAGGYVLASFFMLLFLAVGNWFRAWTRKRRAGRTDKVQIPVDREQKIAKMRLRSLLQTTLNWSFIMLGSIAVLIGATIDSITSW
jgi:hypothetical protein